MTEAGARPVPGSRSVFMGAQGPGLAVVRGGKVGSAKEGHLVDALALRGEEGRGTLRKARGRCERSVIPGSPNGATHPGLAPGYHDLN